LKPVEAQAASQLFYEGSGWAGIRTPGDNNPPDRARPPVPSGTHAFHCVSMRVHREREQRRFMTINQINRTFVNFELSAPAKFTVAGAGNSFVLAQILAHLADFPECS
jgi:hypothetical protein